MTLCLSFRHRAVNLFLQGYEKSWIETEEHYFEDKLIEDLAVSFFFMGLQNERGLKENHYTACWP